MASQQDFSASSQVPGQAQMRRNDQPSDAQNQENSGFLQETGTQMRNMTTGVAAGAVNIAKGAATGAASLATGAADAVKNTLGINEANNAPVAEATTKNPAPGGGVSNAAAEINSANHPSNPNPRS